jgi:hypothetical protein
VQYGADQPEYDLIVADGDKMLKVSVKGSQDGAWGLTQKYKCGCGYHDAIDLWLKNHGKKTIFCFVQFKGVENNELPRMYLASPDEIAEVLHHSRAGEGVTKLRENHIWGANAVASGTTDRIPDTWLFTEERAQFMFDNYA